MSKLWPRKRIGDVVTPMQRAAIPTAGTTYRQIGVRLWGEGAYERESIDGSQTKYAKLYQANAGDIVVNKIWARNGSVAVVDPSLHGTWGSAEFPLFEPDRKQLDPRWVHWITKSPWFWAACDEHAQGTSGKNRIKPEQFLGIQIPLPLIEEQRRIVERIDAVQLGLQQADQLRTSIDQDIASLLAVRFGETLEHAAWRPMREVAPLVRRDVTLDATKTYKELGARSFGKGLFIKPDFDAASATWEKPVWVKAGDLVFSNIKAWEGAIGVAQPEHDGYIASHRYLTSVVHSDLALPEYLLYYLLSIDGLSKVNEASPGTADRNRTTKRSSLEGIAVPVPPIGTQRRFVTLQFELRSIREAQQNLASMRDAVVPALVSQLLSPN